MKKLRMCLMAAAMILTACSAWAAAHPALSITGVVKQPLNLSLKDLKAMQSIEIQLNDVFEDGSYKGAFMYRGIPLRTLLELADIQKEQSRFKKRVDLAIAVRNTEGEQTVLSWGEVFYKNPGNIMVAFSAHPIVPHKNCAKCHEPEVYKPRLNQLYREIGYPKLVVAADAYANRSLESITSIQIIDPAPRMPAQKRKTLYSPQFTVTGQVEKPLTVTDLSGYPRRALISRHLGEGRGYHGLDPVSGAPFRAILNKAGVTPDLNTAFLVSAPDGYRSLFSYGEVFLDPAGERIIAADRMDQAPIQQGGKFFLIPPDDLMADRDVKAVEKIEVISLRQEPRIYVIGVGCGDTDLITLEAISYMAKADVFVCPPDIQKHFSKYMGNKPVFLDLYEFVPPVMKKKHPDLSPEALEALMEKKQAHAAATIRQTLREGKTVAILEYGDPTIWSGSRYTWNAFPRGSVEIVPGISSFNVSNAMIKEDIACNGSVVISTPRGLKESPALVKAMGQKGETLCIFMGLKEVADLLPLLEQGYAEHTPACLVYKAGYSDSEALVRTTLERLVETAGHAQEKFLGLIYVGPCLKGTPAQ
ncbi:MAG: SAM-dependent methyltransferase [Desulfobacteraceae bacterium]